MGKSSYRKDYVCVRADGVQYKRHIPPDVRPVLGGRTAWTKWLGRITRRQAEPLARELAVAHDRVIASLNTLTQTERQQIAAAGGLDAWRAQREHVEAALAFTGLAADYLAPDPETPDAMQAETALEAFRARERLAQLKADADAAKRTARKLNGEASGSLFDLVALWQRITRPRAAKTIDKAKMHVRRFIELVGDIQPRSVVRKHAVEYRDALERMPGLSAHSVEKHLYTLHRLYNVALSEGVVDFNPFSGIKARKDDNGNFADAGKKPFTGAQARLIFERLAELPADDQMVMRLLAYHGMRGGEACQLRACDVTHEHGLDLLTFTDAAGSIKNKPSLRTIPLHPKCHDLVKLARSKAPGEHLFDYPQWKHTRAGKFQQRANAWLRKIGITDKNVTVHSWRHSWRTLARELDMPEPVSRAILGHTMGAGEHGKYGAAPSLKLQAKWIARINPLKG